MLPRPRVSGLSQPQRTPRTARPPRLSHQVLRQLAARSSLSLLLCASCALSAGGAFLPALAVLALLLLHWSVYDAIPRKATQVLKALALAQMCVSLFLNTAVFVARPLMRHSDKAPGSGNSGSRDEGGEAPDARAAVLTWLQLLLGVRLWGGLLDAALALLPPILLLAVLPLCQRSWLGIGGSGRHEGFRHPIHQRLRGVVARVVVRWRLVWILCVVCVLAALCVPSLTGALVFMVVPTAALVSRAVDVHRLMKGRAREASDNRSNGYAVGPTDSRQASSLVANGPSPMVRADASTLIPELDKYACQRIVFTACTGVLYSAFALLILSQSTGVWVLLCKVLGEHGLELLVGFDARVFIAPTDSKDDNDAREGSMVCVACTGSAALVLLQMFGLVVAACVASAVAGACVANQDEPSITAARPSAVRGVAGQEDEAQALLLSTPPRVREEGTDLSPGTTPMIQQSTRSPNLPSADRRRPSLEGHARAQALAQQRRGHLRRGLLHGGACAALALMILFPSVPSLCLLALVAMQSLVAGRPRALPRRLVLFTLCAFASCVMTQYAVVAAARLGLVPAALVQAFVSCVEKAPAPPGPDTAGACAAFPYRPLTALQLLLNVLMFFATLCAYLFTETLAAGGLPRNSIVTAAGSRPLPSTLPQQDREEGDVSHSADAGTADLYAAPYARLRGLVGEEKASQLRVLAEHVDRVRAHAQGPRDEGLRTLFRQLVGRVPTATEEARLLRVGSTGSATMEERAVIAAAHLEQLQDSREDEAPLEEGSVRVNTAPDVSLFSDGAEEQGRTLVRAQWRRAALLAMRRPLSLLCLLALVLSGTPMDALHAVGGLLYLCYAVFPQVCFTHAPRGLVLYATVCVLIQLLVSFLLVNGLCVLPERLPGTPVRIEALLCTTHLRTYSTRRVLHLLAGAVGQQCLMWCFGQAQCKGWSDACTCAELRESMQSSVGHHFTVTRRSRGRNGSDAVVAVSLRRALSAASLGALLTSMLTLGLWWPPNACHQALMLMTLALTAAKAWGYHRAAKLFRFNLVAFLMSAAGLVTLGAMPQLAEEANALAQRRLPVCERDASTPLSASCIADAGMLAPVTYLGATPPALYLSVWYLLVLVAAAITADSPTDTAEEDAAEEVVQITVEAAEVTPPLAEQTEAPPAAAEAVSSSGSTTAVRGAPLPLEEPFLYDGIHFVAAVRRAVRAAERLLGPYGAVWLGWLACATAALDAPCVLNGVYLLGFIVDLNGSLLSAYNLRHLVAVYGYQLNFIPAITATISGIGGSTTVPVDAMVGLVKQRFNDGQRHHDVNEEDPLPALVFCARQVFIALAMMLRATTAARRGAAHSVSADEAQGWQPTRQWLRFLNAQLIPLAGFETLCFVLLLALGASQTASLGVLVALALALTAGLGRYAVPCRRWPTRALWLLLGLCMLWVFLVRLDSVIHALPLPQEDPESSRESEGTASWRRWLWEGNDAPSFALWAALALAVLHQCRRCVGPIAALAAQRRRAFDGCVSLIDFVKAQHVSQGLLALTPDHFSRVIPNPDNLEPGSCASRVQLLFVRFVAYSYPFALMSFLAGAASPPSVLSALLLMGSLLLVAHAESVHLNFYRRWRPISLLYCGMPLVALVIQLPGGVGVWMQRNTGWVFTLSDGLSGAFALSALHVTLLFTVVLQTTVYNSFYFGAVVRHLYRSATTRGERYMVMQRRLAEEAAEEVRRVALHDAEMRAQLTQLTQLQRSNVAPDATRALSIPIAERRALGAPCASRERVRGDSPPATPDDATLVVTDAQGSGTAGMRRRIPTEPVLEEEREAGSGAASPTSPTHASPSPPPPQYPASSGQLPKTGFLDTVLDSVTRYFARHTFRPAACSAAAVPHRGQRFIKAFTFFLVRHTAFGVLTVATANAVYTGCLWEILALTYLLMVALVCYPFAPRAVYQAYLVYVALGIALKASASVYVERVLLRLPPGNSSSAMFIPAQETGAGANAGELGTTQSDWYDASLFMRVLSWVLLDVSGDKGYYWGRSANYVFAFLDFLSFAATGVHQSVCIWEGVYKPAILPTLQESEGGLTTDGYTDAEGGAAGAAAFANDVLEAAEEREGADTVGVRDLLHGSDADPVEEEEGGYGDGDTAAEDDPFSFFYPNSQQQQLGGRAHQADTDPVTDARSQEHSGTDDQVTTPQRTPHRCCCCGGGGGPNAIKAQLKRLWTNMLQVHGMGREYYALYTAVDAAALLFLLLFYGHFTGTDAITLQVNVSNNLLPGPLAAMISLSVLQLVVERAIYVRNSMAAKVISNYVCAVGYGAGYWLWRHKVSVHSTAAGNVYFLLKILSVALSVWQVRSGFPRHRRHDPFTPYPGNSWCFYGYQAVRLVPFLWEARTFIDWTMLRTTLRLPDYVTTEELYDTVYRRRVRLFQLRSSRSYLGKPVGMQSKWTMGVSRVLLILVAILGPLLYYSSLNPSVSASEAAQLRLRLSFMGANTFFASMTHDTVTTPTAYRTWLTRTRPTLATYGLSETARTMQLMELSHCSSDLWLVSPEALRLTMRQLQEAVNGSTAMYIMQSVELLKRSGSATSATDADGAMSDTTPQSVEQVFTSSWPVSADTAATLLRILQRHDGQHHQVLQPHTTARGAFPTLYSEDEEPSSSSSSSSSKDSSKGSSRGEETTTTTTTTTVIPTSSPEPAPESAGANLTNFYTPFLFSRGSALDQLPTPGNRNRMGCELQLRLETDAALGTPVRYWCLACDPLFTGGNVPTEKDDARFPEHRCLYEGRDCAQHNREDGATVSTTTRTPFYAVVLSDPVVGGVSFLKGFGLVALYTTFVLALGRLLRSIVAGSARAMIQSEMADPTAVGRLLESINVARDCGELALEQAGYLALVDLMRSPERLLEVTGRRRDAYDPVDGSLHMPAAFEEDEARQRWLRRGQGGRV